MNKISRGSRVAKILQLAEEHVVEKDAEVGINAGVEKGSSFYGMLPWQEFIGTKILSKYSSLLFTKGYYDFFTLHVYCQTKISTKMSTT